MRANRTPLDDFSVRFGPEPEPGAPGRLLRLYAARSSSRGHVRRGFQSDVPPDGATTV
jgi:hypothetical protein